MTPRARIHWPRSISVNAKAALGILACAVTALIYQRAFELPFVFDDRTTVLLNPALVRPWDLGAILRHSSRAAVTVSYAFDRALWGFSSFGYHFTNIVVHIIAVAVFYGTCTRALADASRTGVRPGPERGQTGVGTGSDRGLIPALRDGAPGLEWAAFFAAAAFGLHPVMSGTAVYVSARSEMLCAVAFMIALMFGRRAILTSRTGPGLVAAAFGAIAWSSSSAAAGLPVVLLAYDAWLLGPDGWRRRLWRGYVPATAAVAFAAAWRLHVYEPSLAGMFENVLIGAAAVWRSLSLLLVPARLAIVHDAGSVGSLSDPVAWLALAAIGASVAAAIRLRRIAPLVSVGVIWLLAALLAGSAIVPRRDAMAEPRLYLAGAGLILAVFAAVAPYLVTRRAARIVATAVLAVLVILTSMRISVWSDPLILWTEAVERAPESWLAHLEFSETLKEAGQCERAVEAFAAAGRLNPHLPLEPVTGWAPCQRPPRRH